MCVFAFLAFNWCTQILRSRLDMHENDMLTTLDLAHAWAILDANMGGWWCTFGCKLTARETVPDCGCDAHSISSIIERRVF